MRITPHQSRIRTLTQDDPNFYIQENFLRSPRAGIYIDKECPAVYQSIIEECVNNKWIVPVANLTERELIFIGLSQK